MKASDFDRAEWRARHKAIPWERGNKRPPKPTPEHTAWCSWLEPDGTRWAAWFDPAELEGAGDA